MRKERPFTHLVDLDEALERAIDAAIPLAREEIVPITHAGGRIVARTLVAQLDLPPFSRATMDGYALRSDDTKVAGARLRLVGDSLAGSGHAGEVPAGACVRIATGAPIPEGADAVVRVEDTDESAASVLVKVAVAKGRSMEAAGSEIRAGSTLAHRGAFLSPALVGAVATAGHALVPVVARPRVRVLVTGDEVTPPGEPLTPGRVHDANGPSLSALFTQEGCEVDIVRVGDDAAATQRAIREAGESRDLLVAAGGASVGVRDLVADALVTEGEVILHGIRMKPGKPLLVGRIGACMMLGLPGNPVSALVCAQLFARPIVHRLQHRAPVMPRVQTARLLERVVADPTRVFIVPVQVDGGTVRAVFRGSGAISALAASTGWIRLEAGASLDAGAEVAITPW